MQIETYDDAKVSDGNPLPVKTMSNALPTGAATAAKQDAEAALIGAVNETAPASDTASSGLNGRLQRIAQRITSFIALLPTALGQGTMAQSLRVVLPSDQSVPVYTAFGGLGVYDVTLPTMSDGSRRDPAVDVRSRLRTSVHGKYETVAASQTDQVLGGAGAAGDIIMRAIIQPATTSPGAVSIKDGAGSAITIFAGGAASVADTKPFWIELGMMSAAGAWSGTTGADVSVIFVGDFT